MKGTIVVYDLGAGWCECRSAAAFAVAGWRDDAPSDDDQGRPSYTFRASYLPELRREAARRGYRVEVVG